MRTSRWPISHLPISDITPFTYRDGETYLELLNRLSQYITEQLHPNLRKTVEHMVEEMEHILAAQHNKYVEGIQDFQRIHDAFMTDVNSALMALNDNAVTDLARDPGSAFGSYLQRTINALGDTIDSSQRIRSHREFGIVGGSIRQIQDAVDGMNPGDILTLPTDMVFVGDDEQLIIDKPVTIRGGSFRWESYLSDQRAMIEVSVSGVTLEDGVYRGIGNTVHHRDRWLIRFEGTESRYISFTFRNNHVSDTWYSAVYGRFVRDFDVSGNTITDVRYSGIGISSGKHGVVKNNTVKNVVGQSSQNYNSYGIFVTNTASLALTHRSEDIEVSHNHVSGVPHWEGLDTHSGQNIRFLYNVVKGCRRGIALVAHMDDGSKWDRNSGPSDILVHGNSVDGSGASTDIFDDLRGISLGGALNRNDNDSVVTSNTIVNYSENPIFARFERPDLYRWNKMVCTGNVSDLSEPLPTTNADSGWGESTRHLNFEDGVSPGRLRTRLQVVDGRATLNIKGTLTFTESGADAFTIRQDIRVYYPTSFNDLGSEFYVGSLRTTSDPYMFGGVTVRGNAGFRCYGGDVEGLDVFIDVVI